VPPSDCDLAIESNSLNLSRANSPFERSRTVKSLKGMTHKPETAVSIEDMNAAIAAHRAGIRK
jgi:hypothetical protein